VSFSKIFETTFSTVFALGVNSNYFEIGKWKGDKCLQIFEMTNTTAYPRQAFLNT
jgi:hypothetical protein